MGAYIIRRLLWMFVLLWAISFITFVIFYILPSADPAQLRAGREAELRSSSSRSATTSASTSRGTQQYWTYMKNVVLHFDFGYSYFRPTSRSRTRSSTACPRRSRSASARRSSGSWSASRSGSSRRSSAAPGSTGVDGPRARRDLRARLLARARRRSTSSPRTSGVPALQGRRDLPADVPFSQDPTR